VLWPLGTAGGLVSVTGAAGRGVIDGVGAGDCSGVWC
jgi:hypothetical protein